MELSEKEIQGGPEIDEQQIPSMPEVIPDIEPPALETSPKVALKADDNEFKRPAWVVMLISVWVIGIYIAFYYFLIAQWAVHYTLER